MSNKAERVRVEVEGKHQAITLTQCYRVECTGLGLNSRYRLVIEGVLGAWFNPVDFHQSRIQLIQRGEVLGAYTAELLSHTVFEGLDKRTQLVFGCVLHRLDNIAGEQHYFDLTLEQIITHVLGRHQIQAVFHFKNQQRHPCVIQGGVSDYDFLQRLCAEYGLVFYYRHEKKYSMLHFTEGEMEQLTPRTLLFNPNSGLNDSSSVITALHGYQQCLPQQVRLGGVMMTEGADSPPVVAHNATDVPGHGQVNYNDWHPLAAIAGRQALAKLLCEQLDCQREWLQLKASGVTVHAGDVVSVRNHLGISATCLFRVIRLRWEVDVGENSPTQVPLSQFLDLIPQAHPYRMPIEPTRAGDVLQSEQLPAYESPVFRPPSPGLQRARIVANPQGTVLDEQGRYFILPLLACAADTVGHGEYAARALQLAAGMNQNTSWGMAFSLAEGARVVLGYVQNRLELPIILGVLPDLEQPAPVTASNASALILRHTHGSALALYDTPHQQHMHWHTHSREHGLSLEQHSEHEQVALNSLGSMSVSGKRDMAFTSGQSVCVRAKTCQWQAGECLGWFVEETMHSEAQYGIYYTAGNDWLARVADGAFMAWGYEQLTLSGRHISLKANAAFLRSTDGRVSGTLGLRFKASQWIQWGVGSSSMRCADAGITLQSAQITIVAGQVVKQGG